MSAKVLVVCSDRVYQRTRSRAEKKVRSGGFRWLDKFTIAEIPRATAPRRIVAFFDGPPASMTDWAPRGSAGYLVMQLRTPRRCAAP